jgi:hypothetical protein
MCVMLTLSRRPHGCASEGGQSPAPVLFSSGGSPAIMYDMACTGVWKCLTCRHETEATPQSAYNDPTLLPLTAGQREVRYCPGCSAMTVVEYQVRPRGHLPRDNARPPAVSTTPHHVLQAVAVTPVTATAVPAPQDLSALTDERLVELRAAIDAELHSRRQCVVCCERPKSCVFYPCKHQCCCASCAAKCQECPVCRGAIQDRISPFV